MFSIGESIRYGWNKAKEHVELVLLATLLTLAISALVEGIGNNKQNLSTTLLWLLGTLFLIIIKIGYYKIFLRIYDGESPKFADIFKGCEYFWRYLGTSILFSLAVCGGLILLVIPGIFWAVRFSFSPIIVVDTKTTPIAAMKESYAITKNNFWKILLFWMAIILINLIGLMLFGIGLIITIPVSTLASVYVYRELSKMKAGLMQNSSPQSV